MKTVLIVEDEFAVAEALAEFLTDAGYKAVTAYDGEQGLARLSESRPDLVILDLMLPVLDGLGMLERMRAESALRGIPVLIMSASHRPDESVSFSDFISKPFNIDTLLAKVARLIGPGR